MTPPARLAAAIEILDAYLAGSAAEKALTGWARRSRFAGSKDRAAIRDIVFVCIRCRRSFAAMGGGESGRGLALGYLCDAGLDPADWFTGDGHAPGTLTAGEKAAIGDLEEMPDEVRLDVPNWLLDDLKASLGDDFGAVMTQMRARASVFLRVNSARVSIASVISKLEAEDIAAEPHPLAKTAILVTRNARKLRQSSVIESGLAEFQDAASQAVCASLVVAPEARILDYCAGGGGKALALADRPHGAVFAHDADPARMRDLPIRAARAEVEIEVLGPEAVIANAPYDIVFCDVPCSGSGAWRRAPDGKWRLSREMLDDLLREQSDILEGTYPMVAPDGVLAYATCSLLDVENSKQIEAFLARHPDWICTFSQRFTPLDGGDGFFCAHLTRKPGTL
ncbi:MAG: RsmB/NOP family class I SAM-dependent RNA methyltransferase [Litoreibacter sp.]|nr:RsmB/NOP family class I SAM-dependent RNA methyltransferase [Litoreibacter sp.]